ncbi:MAG: adenine deaminase [Dehalococcoidia bacterium]
MSKTDLKRLIAVARGDLPADLVLANARIVNTFTGEVERGSVAVAEGRVAGVGDYSEAAEVVDLEDRYLAPGLIDGHVHIESSMLDVEQYARAVVPRGTLTAVTDLHEIANVTGLRGIRYVRDRARRVPLDLFFMAPSCVPATGMETSGATLGPAEVRQVLGWRDVLGLGEVMNFPGVVSGSDDMLDKIAAAGTKARDGHAPGLSGRSLNAYLCPLLGSDHEVTTYEEGLEKLRRGMHLMIREGSAEKNLEDLLPLVTDGNYHRCMLVVDDRSALDIIEDGDLDAVVRKAISLGLDPVRAVQMASLNTARYFRLDGRGGIGPGYYADLLVIPDLHEFRVERAYSRGKLVARDGEALFDVRGRRSRWITNTFDVAPVTAESLALRSHGRGPVPVIEIIPGQIVTGRAEATPRVVDGAVRSDPERDLLKLAVIERHRATGNVGVALVRGFGLRRGAIGTSIAHDSHNIVVAGVSDRDILAAVEAITASRGGLVCVADGEVLARLELPIAGLMSPEPLETVATKLRELEAAAAGLGCPLASPFSVLSFLALPVIPALKLTDRGLVDVLAGEFVGAG